MASADIGYCRSVSTDEVGWGKISEDLMDIITCEDGVARIRYQGELRAGKYLRAPLPIPSVGLKEMVNLKANFCYSTPTDPHHSGAYTRSGLEVVFRPNSKRQTNGKSNPSSRSFLNLSVYAPEHQCRSDTGKWETVLHGEDQMRGITLADPLFDIHYITGQDAGPTREARPVPYALVVTVEAPKHVDLFSNILSEYKTLVALEPEVSLPVRA